MSKLIICGLILILLGLSLSKGYFSHIPTEQIHTMRVWEDGSYAIEYKDKTKEVGCLPQGLCND